jgi:predicted Zn-dependent protease
MTESPELTPSPELTESPELADALFDQAIERYRAGESADTLIPVFKEICDRARKNSSAWTCLAWLYLLEGKSNLAYTAASKAVKLNAQDPQARVNLVLAMLDLSKKGIRPHIEVAQQVMMAVAELHDEVQQNIQDGLSRKPDWENLKRVQAWLFGS